MSVSYEESEFVYCAVPDCPWRVLPPATLCSDHGGPTDRPEYCVDAEGDVLDARYLDIVLEGE